MPSVSQQQKPAKKRPNPKNKKPARTPIEPTRMFTPEEAAFAAGVAVVTIRRAIALNQQKPGQGLAHYRIGRRIVCDGGQIKSWVEQGGKTGRSVEDLRQEDQKAEARRIAAGASQ